MHYITPLHMSESIFNLLRPDIMLLNKHGGQGILSFSNVRNSLRPTNSAVDSLFYKALINEHLLDS